MSRELAITELFNRNQSKGAEILKVALEGGTHRAAVDLGWVETTRSLHQPANEARRFFEVAYEHGDTDAAFLLAMMYHRGHPDTGRDITRAITCLKFAANRCHVGAMCMLAKWYMDNDLTKVGHAVVLLRDAASRGHVPSMRLLVDCYVSGVGVEESPVDALEWAYRALEYSHGGDECEAMLELVLNLVRGRHDTFYDDETRDMLYNALAMNHDASDARDPVSTGCTEASGVADPASSHASIDGGTEVNDVSDPVSTGETDTGDAGGSTSATDEPREDATRPKKLGFVESTKLAVEGMYEHGVTVYGRVSHGDAAGDLRIAARMGHPDALYHYACYLRYQPDARYKRDTYIEHLEDAVDKGHARSMYALAEAYEDGYGVDIDRDKAIGLYRQAAMKGHADAAYQLASHYERTGRIDNAEHIKWLSFAADRGHENALCDLAEMYRNGVSGHEPNISAAVEYLEKAIELGSRAARSMRHSWGV